MSEPDPPSFHLRLPPRLKAQLQAARGSNSLNSEIIERLERSFTADTTLRFAEALRPFLATLDDVDQDALAKLAVKAIQILGKPAKSRRKT